MASQKALLIDDDTTIGAAINLALSLEGFETHYQTTVVGIEVVVRELAPDIIVLDVEIGTKNGIDSVPAIRKIAPVTPIIFISSHHEKEFSVRAIEERAVAYLKKPFDVDELIAYIKRHTNDSTSVASFTFGNFKLNEDERTLQGNGMSIHLPPQECVLLKILVVNSGNIVKREELERVIFGREQSTNQSLSNIIARLRKHFIGSDVQIETIHGSGYKLTITT